MNWKFVETLKNTDNIQAVENRFGIKFPKDFIDIVRKFNHGTASPGTFDTEHLKGRSFGQLLDFNLENTYNIISEYELIQDRLPPKVYSFSGDAGGNYLCFDYRKSDNNPEVFFWDHEQKFEIEDDELIIEDRENAYEQHYIEFVADNFTELLNILYEPEEDDDDDEDAEILFDGSE